MVGPTNGNRTLTAVLGPRGSVGIVHEAPARRSNTSAPRIPPLTEERALGFGPYVASHFVMRIHRFGWSRTFARSGSPTLGLGSLSR